MTMTIHNLGLQHSIISQFIAEIRDVSVQTDSMRFRRNLERVGEIMATWPMAAKNKGLLAATILY
jgi:hypothetical protein